MDASSTHGTSVLDVAVILNPGSGNGGGDETRLAYRRAVRRHGP